MIPFATPTLEFPGLRSLLVRVVPQLTIYVCLFACISHLLNVLVSPIANKLRPLLGTVACPINPLIFNTYALWNSTELLSAPVGRETSDLRICEETTTEGLGERFAVNPGWAIHGRKNTKQLAHGEGRTRSLQIAHVS